MTSIGRVQPGTSASSAAAPARSGDDDRDAAGARERQPLPFLATLGVSIGVGALTGLLTRNVPKGGALGAIAGLSLLNLDKYVLDDAIGSELARFDLRKVPEYRFGLATALEHPTDPLLAREVAETASDALARRRQLFRGEMQVPDAPFDAFGHAYGSARVKTMIVERGHTLEDAEQTAREAGEAHEEYNSSSTTPLTVMDLHNNDVGRALAGTGEAEGGTPLKPRELERRTLGAIYAGLTLVIDHPSGQMRRTGPADVPPEQLARAAAAAPLAERLAGHISPPQPSTAA